MYSDDAVTISLSKLLRPSYRGLSDSDFTNVVLETMLIRPTQVTLNPSIKMTMLTMNITI